MTNVRRLLLVALVVACLGRFAKSGLTQTVKCVMQLDDDVEPTAQIEHRVNITGMIAGGIDGRT